MNPDGSTTKLDYKPYDKFKELINSNDSSVTEYFSTNSNGELIIVEYESTSEEIITERTDAEGNKTTSPNSSTVTPVSKYVEKVIDYKSLISQYTTPISFFIELGTVTRNPEFLEKVAELAKKNARIELIVLNKSITEQKIKSDTYTENVYEKVGNKETTTVTTVNDSTTNKTIIQIPDVKISYVNTWICSFKVTYNKITNPQTIEEQDIESAHKHLEDPSELKDSLQGDGNVKWYTNPSATYNEEIITESYDNGTISNYVDNTQDFIDLLDKEYKIPNSNEKRSAGSYLKSGAEVLFQLLRQNPETQGMEQVMRYIMYKYTGKDYGVKELDLSMFEPGDFSSVLTSGGALVNYIKSWENDALWKYETGQTTTMPTKWMTTKDSKDYYIVYEDGSAGHNNVSYGIATFITSTKNAKTTHPIYGVGYYNWQTEFAEYGVDVTKFATGDLVEKEVANAVFAKVISSFESYVDLYLNKHGITLEKWQRDALVSVAYKHGNIGNFADAYAQYGDTEALRTAFKTSKGATPFASNTKRNESYWNLFHNGEYIGRNGDKITSGILDIAETIHAYMEENNYTYCVYFNNDLEECSNKTQCSLAKTFEKSKTSKKSCCATYVSWVLQEAGYLTEEEHSNSASGLRGILLNKGWIKITSVADLQPGDVLCYDGHIEIYAGDSKVYNAGSGPIIRADAPSKKTGISSMMFALRAPW